MATSFLLGYAAPKGAWRWALIIAALLPAMHLAAVVLHGGHPYERHAYFSRFMILAPASVACFIGVYTGKFLPLCNWKTDAPVSKQDRFGEPLRAMSLPFGWWSRRDSNTRPSRCERDALPTELRPQPVHCKHLRRIEQCAIFCFHDSLSRGRVKRMNESHTRNGEFRRVADNLFRYSSSGVYYGRFQINGKDICRSLHTSDRDLAKRRLAEQLDNASKLDPKVGKMTLEELLRLYEERLGQYAPKTIATRQSIFKIFKQSWPHGLNIPVHSVSTGQLELWLARRRANFKNATYNEYARFLRHLFELALKFRVIAASPAAGLKGLRVETPIRATPTWGQFQTSGCGHSRSTPQCRGGGFCRPRRIHGIGRRGNGRVRESEGRAH